MTLPAIRQILYDWQADTIYPGSKSFSESPNRMVPGEYRFTLTQSLNLTGLANPRLVKCQRMLFTQTVSGQDPNLNPNAEKYILDRILPGFDEEFINAVQKASHEILKELFPENEDQEIIDEG